MGGRSPGCIYLSKMDLEALLKVSQSETVAVLCVVCEVIVLAALCVCIWMGNVCACVSVCVDVASLFQSTAQVERLLLERVVDRLGAEIDRVEIKIKVGRGRGWGSFT